MLITNMRTTLAVLALCCTGLALAQTAPVRKMNQITEQSMVDDLAIDEPAAEEGARTRSIRPTARSNTSPARAAAGKSNLLITFNTGSADLTSESKQALGTVAKALQSDKLSALSFSVEGHADPRGGVELNQRLSEARAQSVVAFLVATHSIQADRLSPVGKGSSEPLNADRPDAPENRRVTIVTKRQ